MPAHTFKDDPDFEPTRPAVLFGHHFASIAGAGPIIGPILAMAAFGWKVVLAWILIGSVFIGAVHDYLALILSERHGGTGIVNVAGQTMGKRAKGVFGAFMFITLVFIISVFGALGAKTMANNPAMVIPTFMVILIAIIFGHLVYRRNVPLIPATIGAVIFNLAFIVLGNYFPIDITDYATGFEFNAFGSHYLVFFFTKSSAQLFWFVVLMIYAGVASILPVETLLQPRDYISTFNLYGALGLGIGGLLIIRPEINAPGYIEWSSSKGPLWPMLFILVACGAVSGFHSLVSGGTTSKQLDKEKDAKPIAFGGMLLEAVLAIMTLFLVACGFQWAKPEGALAGSSVIVFSEVMKEKRLISVFGMGFGKIVHDMLPFIGFSLATLIGMITIKTFVLTTLDSATRITRFLVQESLGGKAKILNNRYVALAFCLIPAFYFGYDGGYQKIWPMFGASNQLIASLALFVIASYLVGVKRPTYFTIIPAIFMLVTTVGALVYQAYGALAGATKNHTIGIAAIILILLALLLAYEAYNILVKKKLSPSMD